MKRCALLIVLAAAGFSCPMPGCASESTSLSHSFGRDSGRAMQRQGQLAAMSFREAAEHMATGFDVIATPEPGSLRDEYSRARTVLAKADSRIRVAKTRLRAFEEGGRERLRKWESEIRSIKDEGMRSESRARYESVREGFRGCIDALDAAQETFKPVRTALADRTMFLRNAGGTATSPPVDDVLQAQVEAMMRAVDAAEARSEAFTRLVLPPDEAEKALTGEELSPAL